MHNCIPKCSTLFGCLVTKSHLWLFLTPCTVACPVPLSLEFPRQEYRSGLPFPSPGHLLNPGIECASFALKGRFFFTEPPGMPKMFYTLHRNMKIKTWATLMWSSSFSFLSLSFFLVWNIFVTQKNLQKFVITILGEIEVPGLVPRVPGCALWEAWISHVWIGSSI